MDHTLESLAKRSGTNWRSASCRLSRGRGAEIIRVPDRIERPDRACRRLRAEESPRHRAGPLVVAGMFARRPLPSTAVAIMEENRRREDVLFKFDEADDLRCDCGSSNDRTRLGSAAHLLSFPPDDALGTHRGDVSAARRSSSFPEAFRADNGQRPARFAFPSERGPTTRRWRRLRCQSRRAWPVISRRLQGMSDGTLLPLA